MTTTLARILLRRDTAANWASADPVLSAGETGVETDTLRFKIGDGATAWTDLGYETSLVPTSTKGVPSIITAAGGIDVSGAMRELQFVRSNSGAVTVTANPQIVAGDSPGQELVLFGTSNTNTLTLSDGTGLSLNGACTLKNGSSLYLVWDGTAWAEVSRNDI